MPTWGGAAIFEAGRWHLIVGARAQPSPRWPPNATDTDYPCDSRIVLAEATAPGQEGLHGPYREVAELVPRSSWEPGLARDPSTGALVMLFFGNISRAFPPPPVGSARCRGVCGGHVPADLPAYNLTTTNTYVTVSASGSIRGPWTEPQLAHGLENRPDAGAVRGDGHDWQCASGNPSPAYHPNGTLYAAFRHNPCWADGAGSRTREHIGLWRADAAGAMPAGHAGLGQWRPMSRKPIFGWGNRGGNATHCVDAELCPSHEDPHLWFDPVGNAHVLTHYQSSPSTQPNVHKTRGAYGWLSADALAAGRNTPWTMETTPLQSNTSAWESVLRFANGTTSTLGRRQRASIVRDPDTGNPIALMNGADFSVAGDGCHWGTGFTLIQPLQ